METLTSAPANAARARLAQQDQLQSGIKRSEDENLHVPVGSLKEACVWEGSPSNKRTSKDLAGRLPLVEHEIALCFLKNLQFNSVFP